MGVCMLSCNDNQILTPGPCTPLAPPFAGNGTVGAFASGAVIALNPAPTGGARLFVPVRGDPSITWFDLADDRGTSPGACTGSGQPCSSGSDCCTGFCDGTGACAFQLACGQNGPDQRCDETGLVSKCVDDGSRLQIIPASQKSQPK